MHGLMLKRRKSTWKFSSFLMVLICFVLGHFIPAYAAQKMALTGSSPENSFHVQMENLFPGDSIKKEFDITASYKKKKAELHYEITVSLPVSAGNEYQNQKLETDFIWLLEEVNPGRQANVVLKIVGKPEELVNGLDVAVICHGFNEGDQELRYEGRIGDMVISPDYIFKTSTGSGSGSGGSSGSGSGSGNISSAGPGSTTVVPPASMEEGQLDPEMPEKTMLEEKESEKGRSEAVQPEERPSEEENTEKTVSEYKQETKAEEVSGEIKESEEIAEKEVVAVSQSVQQTTGYSWCCIWWTLLVLLLVIWYLRKKRKEAKKNKEKRHE